MRILVIDRDPVILDLLRHLLASISQNNVVFSSSCDQALQMAKLSDLRFGCILIETICISTDQTGCGAALRTLLQGAPTSLIGLAPSARHPSVAEAAAAGVHDILIKPFDRFDLLAQMERVIKKLP